MIRDQSWLISDFRVVRYHYTGQNKINMRIVITGSSESSKIKIRGKNPSPKGRMDWRGQAVQVYNKFTKKLTKYKSSL